MPFKLKILTDNESSISLRKTSNIIIKYVKLSRKLRKYNKHLHDGLINQKKSPLTRIPYNLSLTIMCDQRKFLAF